MSDEFLTTDDFINASRSPLLQPTRPNYRSTETPPPLDDLDDNYDSDTSETTGEGVHFWKPQSSKGPDYPEVASKAGSEFFTLSPERACADCGPEAALATGRMLNESTRRGVPTIAEQDRVLAFAAYQASERLNAAIKREEMGAYHTSILQSGSIKRTHTIQVHEIDPERMDSVHGTLRESVDSRYSPVHPRLSSPKLLNVKPPPRMSLPAIRTKSEDSRAGLVGERIDSIATSPALAKFTITPADANSQQQLPRMQVSPSQPRAGGSPGIKQTLPSLQTALKQIPSPDSAAYSASTTISRPSPAHFPQFGPSPSSYSTHQSPASAISPPRLSAPPLYWRSSGPETTDSTPSDQPSAGASAGISTPATSYFGHSPSNSVHTSTTIVQDNDNMSAISASSSQLTDGSSQYNGTYAHGNFKCTFPNCSAPLFQTQYLLNSHANVHSNTRPHFCPVQGCPRGPGGQGFKRKNEMIRHGLVHQSPGYVCPFCPDQQHKYPRPDNLQRHVRVHHVDKDRDDPLLREVLAQRPEGGNRGRRRRLGS